VDSSPDVIYRFEPFHRLAGSVPAVRSWMDRLKAQAVREADLSGIYRDLRPAHPLTNKAPFFPVKSYQLRSLGRSQLWPLARVLAPARAAYRAAYTPAAGPKLVFKEVTFVRQLQNLMEHTSIPVIYLVRHPCATVLSATKAPDAGAIARRQGRLTELLLKNAPQLLERFRHVVDNPDPVLRNTLLWLYEVEACTQAVRASPRGMLLTYEQLADDAYLHTARMFDHLGIACGEQTTRFLDALYESASEGKSGPRRTGWGDRYFSVYRNPREQKDSWKRRIASADRQKIEQMVGDSEAVRYCAEVGRWS
jgi:hypothetical protein